MKKVKRPRVLWLINPATKSHDKGEKKDKKKIRKAGKKVIRKYKEGYDE